MKLYCGVKILPLSVSIHRSGVIRGVRYWIRDIRVERWMKCTTSCTA